ncbi:hypothetical protein EDB82DRAFT_575111 [Fusarium venenatum]|uniref:uncharacterized protein n=1 Tax=Fusarium venenatum TaxID=56646 RepID=UPI001D852131|nr:hypothetical protein EDB82DRAFT_575111 [Fusarium venenatum]
MKTSATIALAATATATATTGFSGGYGNTLDWVPECGGCDPLLQECYCGWGFFTPWKDCILKTCEREDLPNGYIWGITRCDPKSSMYVADGVYDSDLKALDGTVVPPLPATPPAWSASPTFISDPDWALETPRSIKSSVHSPATAAEPVAESTAVAEPIAEPIAVAEPTTVVVAVSDEVKKRSILTAAAAESTTKASVTSTTATSTKHATVTDSGSGMTKVAMASVGLASVAVMFLLM